MARSISAASSNRSALLSSYENLIYIIRIKGGGTKEELVEIQETVMATSPNFYNVARPVALIPTLVVK
jgi:hypothetical protein